MTTSATTDRSTCASCPSSPRAAKPAARPGLAGAAAGVRTTGVIFLISETAGPPPGVWDNPVRNLK